MATDAFSAQIIELVRRMPDEAILELVKNRLGMAPFSALAHVAPASRGRNGRATRAAQVERVAPKSKRGGVATKATAARRRGTTVVEDRKGMLDSVERVVKASTGLSASEVARAAAIPQPRAAAALKELKLEKRIFQGGDRRFARYAGDAKIAEAASLAARSSATGPSVITKAARARRAKAAK